MVAPVHPILNPREPNRESHALRFNISGKAQAVHTESMTARVAELERSVAPLAAGRIDPGLKVAAAQ
jgi:hypothetical protein